MKKMTAREVALKLGFEGPFVAYVRHEGVKDFSRRTICGVNINMDEHEPRFTTDDAHWFSECWNLIDEDFRPYASPEEFNLKSNWLLLKECGTAYLVTGLSKSVAPVFVAGKWYSFRELFEQFTWDDGTPIGVKREGV